ncbi:Sap-like sulfolipid-1-addressing protein [Actinomycetospora succinea]|uniref:Sap-like sulfolipid-1-addressing protein n=1 Tax=Actinomycetospora succinea TaxID=663603 RepID=A0A4V3DB99_9PSEU|nr:GAP family protein [Actinomycetospora succinea]TDQ65748.1 Sap-like sulfolipid-1-addressing protein [Actinomycetospora succinea]
MSPEALVLGLVSAVRGVTLAIVYALLLSEQSRRLLVAYVVAGAAITLGVGIVVVTWLHTGTRTSEATAGRLWVDVVLGVLAVVWAGFHLAGHPIKLRRPRKERKRERSTVLPEALDRRLRAPTVPMVIGAGLLTNLPGLYYLAALVAILQTHPGAVDGIVQVSVYTLLRFAAPVAALVLVLLRPDRTMEIVRSAHAWGHRNSRVLLGGLVGAVGIYLVVKGLSGLLG